MTWVGCFIKACDLLSDIALGAIFLFESKQKLDEFRPHQAHTDYRALSSPYLEGAYINTVNRLDHIAGELPDKVIFDMEIA